MLEDPINIPVPKFRYYPQHDLESLWWIGAHFITARAVRYPEPEEGDEPRSEEEEQLDEKYYSLHTQLAAQIFGPEVLKSLVMVGGTHFATKLDMLHPIVRTAGDLLQNARKALVRTHKLAERELRKMDFHGADGVHEMLRDCFAAIAEEFKDADFYMAPVLYK